MRITESTGSWRICRRNGVDVVRRRTDIPGRSRSEGRTVYTIHAAKAVERGDGKVTLHDVGIVCTEETRQGGPDYGNEFEYDQTNGMVRAEGEVHIDLQAPEAADANAKMDDAAGKD